MIQTMSMTHKHITQLPPSRLKFDTKLRKVFLNNLASQLCTSHSCRENIAPNFVCLFQPIKCKHEKTQIFWLPLALVTLLKCLLQDSSVAKSQVCQHSTAQVIVTGKICRVLYVNFEWLFWPIKSMHSKPGFWVHFSHILLLKWLL